MAEKVDIIDIDLSKLIEETEEAGQTLGDLKKEVKDLKKSLDNTAIGTDEFTKSLDLLNKKQDQLKEATRTIKKDVAGSYNALSKEMSDLKKVWKATGDEAERAKLGEKIDDINNQLKELDSTVGVSTRNVGNYQSALQNLEDISFDDKIESSEKLAENMGHVARIGAGLSGVFEIVQGGMNLMGVESEKIEEAMIKIQSLMAITQGLSAVGDSVESFTKLGKAIKQSEIWTKLFTKSKKEESAVIVTNTAVQKANTVATKAGIAATKGLKAALISSGIGAIIVGLGIAVEKLASNWDKLTAKFGKKVKVAGTDDLDISSAESNITSEISTAESINNEKVSSLIKKASDKYKEYKEYAKEKDQAYNSMARVWREEGKTEEEIFNLHSGIISTKKAKLDEVRESIKQETDNQISEFEGARKKLEHNIELYNKTVNYTSDDQISKEYRGKIVDAENDIKEYDQYIQELKDIDKDYDNFVNELADERYQLNEDRQVHNIRKENESNIRRKEEIQKLANFIYNIEQELKSKQEKELQILSETFDQNLEQLDKSLELEVITEDKYNEIKLNLTDKYNKERKEINDRYREQEEVAVQQHFNKLIEAENNRYITADNKLYAGYIDKITGAEDKGYTYEAGLNRLQYFKEQKILLEEHKAKLIEIGATEVQLSEIETMLAENLSNIRAAEVEMWQGRLDGMSRAFDAISSAADSIIGVGDGLSSAWSNVFRSIQAGLNNLGESLKTGGKQWESYAAGITGAMNVASSVMVALADEQNRVTDEDGKIKTSAFEKQKKYQIASVVMNTLSGIVNATSSIWSPVNSGMTAIGQGILTGTTVASLLTMGAVQIDRIKKLKPEGGNSSSLGGISTGSAGVTPSVSNSILDMINNPLINANVVQGASTEANLKNNRVWVSETDISSVQNKVQTMETEATY